MEEMSQYDRFDKKSIIGYARNLEGKTLREVCKLDNVVKEEFNKGGFGQTLEEFYFHYKPNSESRADFEEAGLEVKSSPIKKLGNGYFRSKERLVLNIINYNEIVNQSFINSSFWKKNSCLLLVFYLFEAEKNILDYIIKFVNEWSFPPKDFEIIKRDWESIKAKIAAGKAHELSEGDTFYLGACTKGSKGGNLRIQPFNNELAKQRAFSLKQGYVNHIIAVLANDNDGKYGKLISDPESKKTIEEIVCGKFSKYYGLSVQQITSLLNINLNPKSKNFYASITNLILGISPEQEIEEFVKADIEVRTVRIKTNLLPKEDISFPSFEYKTLVSEEWESSSIKNLFDKKFFFVFYQYEGKDLILKKVKFWNIPSADLQEIQKVWDVTKRRVSEGLIVKQVINGTRRTYFPAKSENRVSHVRPHAKNSSDTFPLPVSDKLTMLDKYTKHSFWLNNSYVRDEIFMKD